MWPTSTALHFSRLRHHGPLGIHGGRGRRGWHAANLGVSHSKVQQALSRGGRGQAIPCSNPRISSVCFSPSPASAFTLWLVHHPMGRQSPSRRFSSRFTFLDILVFCNLHLESWISTVVGAFSIFATSITVKSPIASLVQGDPLDFSMGRACLRHLKSLHDRGRGTSSCRLEQSWQSLLSPHGCLPNRAHHRRYRSCRT